MLRALIVDGAVVSPAAPAFTPLERGLLYGDGLFESIAVHGNTPLEPARHYDRMAASASELGLSVPPREAWDRSLATCLAAAVDSRETVDALRVAWMRGVAGERGYAPSASDGPPRLVVAAFGSSEHQRAQWESGASAATIRGLSPGDLAHHKTLSAMTYVVAAARARADGAAEALLVDEAGRVLETAGSNVFLVRAGRVDTPPAARPILAGIGRARVLGWLGERAAEGDFTPQDLALADEAFLTNAVRGIVPLVELDERAIGGGRPGPLTLELQNRWRAWVQTQTTSPSERVAASAAWITRREIRVNRTATCWLVQRFLDPAAQFRFVEPDEVAGLEESLGGTGFDAPGARYPHKDANGRCSFAALVHERFADDAVLIEMARIVQAADFKDQNDDHPAARGLIAISQGFPLVAHDDHETVARAAFLYDSMYAGTQERLNR